MFAITGYAIDQSSIDVEEVDPNFMMATLIFFLETQRVLGDGEGTMIADLPVGFGTRRFYLLAPTVRIDERLFNTADESRFTARLAAPCCTI